MKLRKLMRKDAPYMLEWMHDFSIVENMKTAFMEKSIEDCIDFIDKANEKEENLHLAVTDDNDEYMGTVSLKHINSGTAEFGITVRRCAMGKGYSKFAMKEIIRIGFEEMNLRIIYWCVTPDNLRAVRFYEKGHFVHMEPPLELVKHRYSDKEIGEYIWYNVVNDFF